jgi:CDGSH-type Zn-finger protein
MSSDSEMAITVYPDGPYLVRGEYRILDENGNEIEVTRRTVALCRCGRSSQKPWCDSSHKLSRSGDPAVAARSPRSRGNDSPVG